MNELIKAMQEAKKFKIKSTPSQMENNNQVKPYGRYKHPLPAYNIQYFTILQDDHILFKDKLEGWKKIDISPTGISINMNEYVLKALLDFLKLCKRYKDNPMFETTQDFLIVKADNCTMKFPRMYATENGIYSADMIEDFTTMKPKPEFC